MAIHIELRDPEWSRQLRRVSGAIRPAKDSKTARGGKRSQAGKTAIELLSKKLSRRMFWILRYLLAHPAYCGEPDQKVPMP